MMRPPYKLVPRSDVGRTRPVLERARYRCQKCGGEDNLRVVEERGELRVTCDTCRIKTTPVGVLW